MNPGPVIGRAVFWLLGGVELLVDGYDSVRRLVTRREKPIPLGKPKVRDLIERQANGSGVRAVPPTRAVPRDPHR